MINRRGFLKGVAAVILAAAQPIASPIKPALSKLAPPVRTTLPACTWKKLNYGIQDPGARLDGIIELLSETNQILEDLPWQKK